MRNIVFSTLKMLFAWCLCTSVIAVYSITELRLQMYSTKALNKRRPRQCESGLESLSGFLGSEPDVEDFHN